MMTTVYAKLRAGTTGTPLLTILLALFLVAGFASFASAKSMPTSFINASDIEPGTYTLIMHGCNSSEEPGNVAFLQKEAAPYSISLRGAQTESGLPADQAVKRAEKFAMCNPSAQRVKLTDVKGPDGSVIGYEVAPVYAPLRFGAADPVDVHYKVRGNDVVAYLTPDPMTDARYIEGIG